MDRPFKTTRAERRDAFEAVVEAHRNRVFGLAIRLTGSVEDAKEITQDAFVRLHANFRQLSTSDQIQRWLRVVTVNLCRDSFRRRRAVAVLGEDASRNAPSTAPTPEALASAHE